MNAITMHRFYRLDVQRDLFWQWCLIREWGSLGRAGQTRIAAFPTQVEAQVAIDRQRQVKARRGRCEATGVENAH